MRALREYIRLHIQDILVEGRLEDAKKKYADRVDDQTFQLIVANDPSGNHKYLDWACREIVSGAKPDDVIPTFNEWERVGKNLSQKDIYKFSAKQAEDALKDYDAKQSGKRKQKYGNISGATPIGETERYIVYRITTHEASRTLGSGTKWCVTMNTDRYWNMYTEEKGGKFHFFIPKSSSNEKLACLTYRNGSQEVYAEDDSIVDLALTPQQECRIAWTDVDNSIRKLFLSQDIEKYDSNTLRWILSGDHLKDQQIVDELVKALYDDSLDLSDAKNIVDALSKAQGNIQRLRELLKNDKINTSRMMALCSLIIRHLGEDMLEDIALHDELSRGARFAFSHVYEKLARKADQNNDERLKRDLISMLDKPGMNSSAIVQISLLLPTETLLKIASDPSAEVFSLIAASKYYPKQVVNNPAFKKIVEADHVDLWHTISQRELIRQNVMLSEDTSMLLIENSNEPVWFDEIIYTDRTVTATLERWPEVLRYATNDAIERLKKSNISWNTWKYIIENSQSFQNQFKNASVLLKKGLVSQSDIMQWMRTIPVRNVQNMLLAWHKYGINDATMKSLARQYAESAD